MVLISWIERWYTSLANDFRIVVFPELSNPNTKILSSYFLFLRKLRKMPINPPPWFSTFIWANDNYKQINSKQNWIFIEEINE